MICDVILTQENNRYVAQVREWIPAFAGMTEKT